MNLLNLPDYTVLHVEEGREEYRVTVQVARSHAGCPTCQTGLPVVDRWSRITQTYRDLPMHGKRVVIEIERQRFRCRTGNHTFMEPLPGMDDGHRMTARMTAYIEETALRRPFSHIAAELGINEGTVRRIALEAIQELEARLVIETPTWLGIDELHLTSQPRAIFTNVKARTLVDMLPKRDVKSVAKRLTEFRQRDKIELVLMDMWRPYKQATRDILPQARIVIDKFHVVKMASEAMERIRKDLRETLTDRQRRTLKRDRFILLKRQHNLKEEDQMLLLTWLDNFPNLAAAYHLKETIYEIWDLTDRAEAERRYALWEAAVPEDLKYAFHDLTRALKNWHEEAFSYFDHGAAATNAYTEAMNGVAKVLNRLGRGYSFEMIRAKMLFSPSQRREVVSTAADEPVIIEGNPLDVLREMIAAYEAEHGSTEYSG